MIKLLVVEDLASVRDGLRMLLALEPDIAIVGEAESAEEAIRLATRLRPDVALVDVKLPRMDGIEAAAALHETVPDCAVVILTLYDDPPMRERARRAGVSAFVGKRASPEALLVAIRQFALDSQIGQKRKESAQ